MPIRLERTFNLDLVRGIVTHPRLYPHLSHDFHPPVEAFEPNSAEGIYYMLVTDGPDTLGLVTAHPIISPITWEAHHAILPAHWARTEEIGRAFQRWLFDETPCETIIGFTPTSNRLAIRYAERQGMVRGGVIPAAYPKHGKRADMVLFYKHKT